MSFKELSINRSYANQGHDNFADAFLIPTLEKAVLYERSVGFFSSGVFKTIAQAVMGLVRNDGKIHLIASPKLSQEDIDAINAGYKRRDIIKNAASRDFIEEANKLDLMQLNVLSDLIAEGIMDVQIATTDTSGEYHDKLGILQDEEGNTIVFFGSANESHNGLRENYEKVRVFRSWIASDSEIVNDECDEFEKLWSRTHEYVEVIDFKESIQKNILQIIENKRTATQTSAPIKLRKYQEEAIAAWIQNGCKGFYTMATGTGKTWTAIYTAKELQKSHDVLLVICAPYKHLIKQWVEDLEKVYTDAKIIMVSSENPDWEKQISNAIVAQKFDSSIQIIIVSTIASFNMDRFSTTIKKSAQEKMLIVDEAHRFTKRDDTLHKVYPYMLGLSATPFSGTSAERGLELMSFFGGQVYNLPIEEALEKKFLVPYSYHPIYVNATEDEEYRFSVQSKIISSCFVNNKLIDKDKLVKALRNRLRIISMASEKIDLLDGILDQVKEKDHLVVYCGDGKLFDEESGDYIRHIQDVKKVITKHNMKASQFTCAENMSERMSLIGLFNKGNIDALAAIRCLDEGVNIPSIKAALILSSNDDYREFVQRRGRILRKYDGKECASIYDVVVLPSSDLQSWAKIELRRFHEYAKLATNKEALLLKLETMLSDYGLTIDDVDVFDYDDMEADLDE